MKPKKTTTAALTAIFILLAAGWAFLIYRSYSLKEDMRQISEADKEKSAESSYLASLRTLMREEKDNIQTISGIFIREEDIPAFVESLESKAAAAGIEANLGSLNLGAANEGSAIAPLTTSIVAKGPWANLVRFISDLDSLPTASKIDAVSLSKIEAQSPDMKGIVWNARVDFTQYVERSNKSAK